MDWILYDRDFRHEWVNTAFYRHVFEIYEKDPPNVFFLKGFLA